MCQQHMETTRRGFFGISLPSGMFSALIVEATNVSVLAVKFKTPGNIKSMTVCGYCLIEVKPPSQRLPAST